LFDIKVITISGLWYYKILDVIFDFDVDQAMSGLRPYVPSSTKSIGMAVGIARISCS